MEHLYVSGMDDLLAQDAAFFHDNFAGSLTKRVLSFGKRFEDFVDTVTYRIVGSLVPLVFGAVVLWSYEPMLVVGLLVMIALTVVAATPLIRRRQRLVNDREAAIARVSGHVADSLTNMETIRAFAAEEREADEHRSRVADSRRLTLRSWDYGNLRVDVLIAPMSVLTNVLGLLVAIVFGGPGQGVEEVIVAFTYYSNATQIMFEFNQIYRRLESSMTEAAQFTELLLDPPTVLDPAEPEPLGPRDTGIRFDAVTFAHAGAKSIFQGLDLDVPAGARIGLVGRSGGGKTTLTRLLLRMSDIDDGRILIGGQDISRLCQTDLRSLIAYVPQEPAMFHRSLRDNIAFARPGATDEEIHAAAAAAHVTEFADQLPDASPPWWGSGESNSREASASASPSPGPSCATPRSCCSTRRPARWTRRVNSSSRTPVAVDGRTYGPGGRPPSEHRRRHGPSRRPGPGHRRRAGHPRGTARGARCLRQAVAAPVGWLPGREHRIGPRGTGLRSRSRRAR